MQLVQKCAITCSNIYNNFVVFYPVVFDGTFLFSLGAATFLPAVSMPGSLTDCVGTTLDVSPNGLFL